MKTNFIKTQQLVKNTLDWLKPIHSNNGLQNPCLKMDNKTKYLRILGLLHLNHSWLILKISCNKSHNNNCLKMSWHRRNYTSVNQQKWRKWTFKQSKGKLGIGSGIWSNKRNKWWKVIRKSSCKTWEHN